MKLLLMMFLFFFTQVATLDKCKASNSNNEESNNFNSDVLNYLEGEWIAKGQPSGLKVEEVIRLKIDRVGHMKVTYLLAQSPNEQDLQLSTESGNSLSIEKYGADIRIQRFSENEFKFYQGHSTISSKPTVSEDLLFVYNFKRVG